MTLWRLTLVVGLLCFATASTALADVDLTGLVEGVALQHKWTGKCEATGCTFKSAYQPPFPFDYAKHEAILMVSLAPLSKPTTLNAALQKEIAGIREDEFLDEYAENDYQDAVEDRIAAFKEKILGKVIGFIKYRSRGPKDSKHTPNVFTVIHSVEVTPSTVAYTHLLTFFAAHQDEVRADQQTLIRALIKKIKESA